ncbi:drug resistance transporter, EmrB/QacA subfamily [Streptomyces wuyuanensis]|uniref:Drug resistance transporter, EmrB/QacA subfamily n=1 Tax=Streptomyces wuyuanensis TaxID=1196353 RepID=A0A1G9XJ06_9ACTN|nr:drug resistance transporter, EmrB/QacA subfamily [Streptomyces wuyuanensis]
MPVVREAPHRRTRVPVVREEAKDVPFPDPAGGDGSARSPEPAADPGKRPWKPLLAVCAGYFMVILDVTIINVAVPVVGRELSASLTGIQWITDGYTLVLAGLMLTGRALGDRLGNRRIFCAGVAVFTAASAVCALAPNTAVLVAARLVEGLGAALIVPGSLALLEQAYPASASRAWAFGLWGSMAGIAASAGPLLGGLLVTTMGWRWVFLINLPVGVACLALTLRHVAPSPRDSARALDWPAQCAVVAAVALLTAALNEAGRRGWSDPAVLAALGLAVAAAVAFTVRERLARTPALPMDLLRSRALSGGAAIGLLFNFGFYGMVFTASLSFQHERGYSALGTGAALFPAVAMTTVRLGPVRAAQPPDRRPPAGDLRNAPGRPRAGGLGGGGRRSRVPAPRGPHDGRRIRHLLRPHRVDRHGDGRRTARVRGNRLRAVQHHAPDRQRHRSGPRRHAARDGGRLRRGPAHEHGRRGARLSDRRGAGLAVRPAQGPRGLTDTGPHGRTARRPRPRRSARPLMGAGLCT